jgi:hypothetical protein
MKPNYTQFWGDDEQRERCGCDDSKRLRALAEQQLTELQALRSLGGIGGVELNPELRVMTVGSVACKLDGLPDMKESATVIRSGDLVPGKRYRIVCIYDDSDDLPVNIGERLVCVDYSPQPKLTISRKRLARGWFARAERDGGAYVTAVELVDDELASSLLDGLRLVQQEAEANPSLARRVEQHPSWSRGIMRWWILRRGMTRSRIMSDSA